MGMLWNTLTNAYDNYNDEDEKKRIIAALENDRWNLTPLKDPPSKDQVGPKNTIYQCLDGAMVIEYDGLNSKRSTMDEALSKFKHSPVIKLNDMNFEMVEVFISNPAGAEALQGISPLSPAQDIPFDRDHPPSYKLITLVAMAASLYLAQLEAFRPEGHSGPKNALSELMYQIALIQEDGKISPYE
ncbi:hypothetical protein GE09DRAFT_1066874 [Coniochaeta sp. 2T2.1]|nr:hypothetical protein GE09DRAFT_1066874 [Coniochaeta sp. 2T2.1]